MSLYEPMYTDHRQTLLGLNQDNELERLISDVMNHKVSPNALAMSYSLCQVCSPLRPENAQASVNSSLASLEVCRRIYHTVRRSERLWAGLWTDIVIEQVLMRSLKSRGDLTRGRGMTESVRQQWVYSMHACAAIHDAMTSLTGKHHTTSHQHC